MISCEMEDTMLYQDIPRIYTAIAEWGSCLVYLYILKKENMKSVHFLIGSLFMLAMQSIFLTLTGSVTEILWIPCMVIAAGMMYGFLMVGGNMKPLGAAYCCARAFVLAEFAASLQWQMVSIVQAWGNQSLGVEILITMVVFGGCFTIDIYLEKDLLKQNYLEQMTVKEVPLPCAVPKASANSQKQTTPAHSSARFLRSISVHKVLISRNDCELLHHPQALSLSL